MLIVSIVFSSLIIAILSVPLLIRLAHKYGFLDRPGERRIHQTAIPRLGGVAIFAAIAVGFALFQGLNDTVGVPEGFWKIVWIGLPLAFLVGLGDDIFSVGSKRKLVAQLLLGACAFYLGFRIEVLSLGGGHQLELGQFGLPLTMIWVASVMNAINLIDGMDGLAPGVSAITFIAAGIFAFFLGHIAVGSLSLICAAACVGFLYYNFHPAKIFMGDSGSMVLGFLLAILTGSISPRGPEGLPIFVPLLLLAFPAVDTSVAIVRRVIRTFDLEGPLHDSRWKVTAIAIKRTLSADGDHIHHRLLNKGLSQRQVAYLLYAFSALAAGLSFLLVWLPAPFSWMFAAAAVVGIRQMVLALDYTEFGPREIRQKELVRDWEDSTNSRPAIARRVSR